MLKNTKLAILVISALTILVGAFVLSSVNNSDQLSKNRLTFGQSTFSVDISDTVSKRQQGLSGRESLADDEGMIFVFEEPGLHGFWMKDMLISIDIIWIDQAKKVVHIEESVSPDTYPEISFYPSVEALYVLEIASGRAEEIDLGLGDELAFDLR